MGFLESNTRYRFATSTYAYQAANRFEDNKPSGLVLHSVGEAKSDAEYWCDRFNDPSNPGMCHGFIDASNGCFYQILPFSYKCSHVGGSLDDTHLGIEMCEPPSGCITYTTGAVFTVSNKDRAVAYAKRTINSAVKMFAELCIRFGLDPKGENVILSHSEAYKKHLTTANHADPEHLWRGLGMDYNMDKFRNEVASIVADGSAASTSANTPEEPIPDLSDCYQVYATAILDPITETGEDPVMGWNNYYFNTLFKDGKTYFDYKYGRGGNNPMDLARACEEKGCAIQIGDCIRLKRNEDVNMSKEDCLKNHVFKRIYTDSSGSKVAHEFIHYFEKEGDMVSFIFIYRVYYIDDSGSPIGDVLKFFNLECTKDPVDIHGVITINGESTDILDLGEFEEKVSNSYLYNENGVALYDEVKEFLETYNDPNKDSSIYVSNNIFDTRNILGIFGIPYQFMPHVDPRIPSSSTVASAQSYVTDYRDPGVEYSDHILSTMPLLFLSPGLPDFMTNFTKTQRRNIIDLLGLSKDQDVGSFLDSTDLGTKSGRYYTFKYTVAEYYLYCNPICRIASAYLGVNEEQVDNINIESMNWADYTAAPLNSLFAGLIDPTSYASIPFYIDSETQISDTFNNDTTESSLASTINSFSSAARDLSFIIGYSQARTDANLLFNVSPNAADSYSGLKDFVENLSGSEAVQSIAADIISVASGGKLLFPKIWADSSFSRSYDISIKLRSPDNDPLSLYLNILVPFFHIFCMAIPRDGFKNPNALFSPFIVRAIYKGFFNIDMGIITSLSVTKGDTAQWTPDGIPTCIDINLSIADLYENISITKTESTNFKFSTTSNTCLMDYIANTCGINIYQPEIARAIRMWTVNNTLNRAKDAISIGVWAQLRDNVAQAITNVWRPGL